MSFVNMSITAGDDTWKANVNYSGHTFSELIFIYLINLKYFA